MIIGIPVYEGVDVLDVTGPFEMFHWAGYDIEIVAQKRGPVVCNGGLVIHAEAFGKAGAWDVLWTPGGNPQALNRMIGKAGTAYRRFLNQKATDARYVCSVCEGALILAAAGLLDGFTVTTHWAFIPCLLQSYPKITVADGHPRFVLDGNRLTGGGISSGLDEALELIKLLSGEAAAVQVQQTTQYYPDPPVSSQIPNTISCPLP
ncbi:cyclohexyl-isocyanide hydratase [Caulobacter ginsengisoli]|uniref:Cyclohexyl-isocyanide hydratase n=1 Tax=Caulobacter ginsengisoli TaxID=400775 RepID=A0ABU0IW23_9CAUL|nr:DJ-1/PfpI family protein [Caulobacter ginsengisoli]MDQ0466208.1 cyclohexyl-isocyanide hydratase [Caulobacter ginsengisoli]